MSPNRHARSTAHIFLLVLFATNILFNSNALQKTALEESRALALLQSCECLKFHQFNMMKAKFIHLHMRRTTACCGRYLFYYCWAHLSSWTFTFLARRFVCYIFLVSLPASPCRAKSMVAIIIEFTVLTRHPYQRWDALWWARARESINLIWAHEARAIFCSLRVFCQRYYKTILIYENIYCSLISLHPQHKYFWLLRLRSMVVVVVVVTLKSSLINQRSMQAKCTAHIHFHQNFRVLNVFSCHIQFSYAAPPAAIKNIFNRILFEVLRACGTRYKCGEII